MDFTVRPMEASDIASCVELLRGRCAYSDRILGELPRVWRCLIREDALNAVVVERSGHAGPNPVCFGASVIVTDDWFADALRGREPYLTARTVDAEMSGHTPILRPRAIAQLNAASGLNVLVLHHGETREPLSVENRAALRFRMWRSFIDVTRGYQMKALAQEFWDEIDPEYVVQGWGRVVTDYAEYFSARGLPLPPIGHRPHLLAATRDEVRARPGDIASPLFVYTPPRICFSRAEQRLLQGALQGLTDHDLAARLRLTLATIKTTWRNIYSRVHRFAPDVLPDSAVDPARSSRQREKRRRVLEYVRRHPEDLRPDLVAHRGERGRPRAEAPLSASARSDP